MPTPCVATVPPSTRARLVLIAVLGAVLGSIALVAGSWAAFGHAQLVSSTPADGDILAEPPTRVVLTYNEEINPEFAQIVLADSTGRTVPAQPEVTGPTVVVPLPTALPAGEVAVRYRVVSRDGHPIAGQIAFVQESGATMAPSAPDPSGSATGPVANPSPDVATITETDPAAPTQSSSGIDAIYVLTGVSALILVGAGVGLFLWDRRR